MSIYASSVSSAVELILTAEETEEHRIGMRE